MEKIALNQTLEELRIKSRNYQDQVEFRVLEKCPFIVQVGALTITTDETGKVITHNTDVPTQFSQKAVDEILTMTFKNGNGEVVIPKVYTRKKWYEERINDLTEIITQFEQLLNL